MKIRAFESYVNQVINQIPASYKVKKRIKMDLLEALYAQADATGLKDPVEMMGPVVEVAREFTENLSKDQIRKDFYPYEYKSVTHVFGMPLIHVISGKFGTAIGVIAIGPKSIGLVSVGGIALGIISFGGFSAGLITLGGMALGYYLAIGGMAISKVAAIGGLAVAHTLAIGGLAISKEVAIGGQASGVLMGYTETFKAISGKETFAFRLPDQVDAFMLKFENLYPRMSLLLKGFIKLIL
ncbi:hypothetical protein [Fusibacter ferrireducens]|uniref:Uncharacterized protein n=1 Tax=Fusibacter ferrireducens TaxID=2785058 RepID=A0ABR9ZUH7_9FIRM|nr:hypothetical protein [Fusibacter ferrireducens]MBF4694124.1 hypothetical protein [Fusibacter ferrireducens]